MVKTGVIIHLENDLPIVVDMEELPHGSDRVIHCTNVRTVDGKRPAFVHDRNSTFVFPLGVIRLIEAPAQDDAARVAMSDHDQAGATTSSALSPATVDEEPDQDLLARIRQV